MLCDFQGDDGTHRVFDEPVLFQCERPGCGREIRVLSTPIRWADCPGAPGLGDHVAATLKKAGIKTCGGCNRRRKLLNKAGRILGPSCLVIGCAGVLWRLVS